jgi:hypothetical protein
MMVRTTTRAGLFGGGYFFLAALPPAGAPRCQALLGLGGRGTDILFQGGGDDVPFSSTREIVPGTWASVEIILDGTGTVPTIAARIDGHDAVPASPLADCSWGGTLDLAFGPHCVRQTEEVRFDDVSITIP